MPENILAERTGLEPATSSVTGKRSNQLNYRSKYLINSEIVAKKFNLSKTLSTLEEKFNIL